MAEIKSESSEITPATLPAEPKITPGFYAYNIFPEHLSTVLPVLPFLFDSALFVLVKVRGGKI